MMKVGPPSKEILAFFKDEPAAPNPPAALVPMSLKLEHEGESVIVDLTPPFIPKDASHRDAYDRGFADGAKHSKPTGEQITAFAGTMLDKLPEHVKKLAEAGSVLAANLRHKVKGLRCVCPTCIELSRYDEAIK